MIRRRLLWVCAAGAAIGAPPARAQQRCAVAEVVIAPPDAQIAAGAQVAFQATAYDQAGSPCEAVPIAWASGNVNVVRIDPNGVATGVAPGVAVITAQATGTTRRGQASVTVTAQRAGIASIELSPRQVQVRVGAAVRLAATALDSSGSPVPSVRFVWVSSDLSVARVGADGIVTGVAPGRTTIYTGVAGRRGFVGAVVEVVAGSGRPNPNRR
jgi:uncharacterized protein YjdB